MTDLIHAVRSKSDKIKATVVTRNFQFDGELHCPKTGKETRRLSNLLNNNERQFIAMTNVTITNRLNGTRDTATHQMLQVNIGAIEFIKPYPGEEGELLS